MTRRLFAVLLVLAASGTAFSAAAWAGADAGAALSPAQIASHEIRWTEKRLEKVFDGELAEGGERTFALDVRQANVTRVDAVLSWVETHDRLSASREDTFRLEMRAPDGAPVGGSPARSDSNVIVLRSGIVNPLPEPASVGEAEAAEIAAARASAGQGPWRVVVALESTGNPAKSQVDTGNSFVLTFVVRWYEAVILKSIALEPRTGGPGSSTTPWEWATYGLGGASALLGGLVLFDPKRKR